MLVGGGDISENMQVLIDNNVTTDDIIVEDKSFTTYENAVYAKPLLESMGVRKVILVTFITVCRIILFLVFRWRFC